MGRHRLTLDPLLPPGVYRHGKQFRTRKYDKSGKPVWHTFRSNDPGGVLKEWSSMNRKRSKLKMSDIFARYMTEVGAMKSDATQVSDKAAALQILEHFGKMKPTSVKPMHVVQYMEARARVSPTRANRERSLLSHVLTKCVHWGLIEHNPLHGLHYKIPEQPRTRYVLNSEFLHAAKIATPMMRHVMHLILATGLRRKDVLSLHWRDFQDDGLHVTISKSRKAGVAPIKVIFRWTLRLRAVYNAMQTFSYTGNSDRPCFPGTLAPRSPIPAGTFGRLWADFQADVERSGVERFQLKDLRAKVATDLDAKGGDATRKLAHTSASTTRRHYQRKPQYV